LDRATDAALSRFVVYECLGLASETLAPDAHLVRDMADKTDVRVRAEGQASDERERSMRKADGAGGSRGS
jgi:hypothetical protein